jgi:16S rRNA (adenine1518-N6/adenine1519-N6)-dimethyltransferase
VVEIGAGTGSLTVYLAERSRSVMAIERDRDLVPLLKRAVACSHVQVIEGDAQSVDFGLLLGGADPASPRVLCGNLPYAITGPLLRHAIEGAEQVERVVFLVQKEVADRLAASPGDKSWGALTVFARAAYDVRRLLRVPPGAFYPSPEVTSALVELVPVFPRRARETDAFRALVRSAFDARRKTLRNAWAGLFRDASTLERAAARAGVDLQARGETLDVAAFARMAHELENSGR